MKCETVSKNGFRRNRFLGGVAREFFFEKKEGPEARRSLKIPQSNMYIYIETRQPCGSEPNLVALYTTHDDHTATKMVDIQIN